MIRASLLALAIAALVAAPSCAPARNTCSDVHDRLKACGFPVAALDCTRIDRSTEEALAERLDARGCAGVAYGDTDAVDPRVCTLAGWPCPVSPIPEPGPAAPRYPLVLVSGIDGSPTFDWNPKIATASGAHHVQVLPWATTKDRGTDLWQSLVSLRSHLGGAKLNLVCYAVGGIDCRYVASPGGLFKGDAAGYRDVVATVASITTISTPHRGTRVAEAALSALRSGAAADLLQTLVGSSATTAVPGDAALSKTLDGLTLEALEAFNRDVTDAPGVFYQSWAGVSHVLGKSSAASETSIREHCTAPNGDLLFLRHKDTNDAMNELLWITAPFASTSRNDRGTVVSSPSDGMVSVESAKWGEFRGCIPADHYDVIGQIAHTTRDGLTGFDAPRFLRYVASGLAERGL